MMLTFKVTDTKAELPTSLLERMGNSDFIIYQIEKWFDKKVIDYKLNSINLLNQPKTHPFLYALDLAYSDHYPITFSPDMFWVLIAQGIAQHCDLQPEEVRKFFVDHEGKKELLVQRDDFNLDGGNPWPEVFTEIINLMQKEIGEDRVIDFIPKFSTTSDLEATCFNLSLMDVMKNYFDYTLRTCCSMTEITLEGEKADWELLKEHAGKLRKYDLGWWAENLEKALQPFIDAFDGEIDTQFFSEFYKETGGSGGPFIQGNVLKFFPYIDKQKNLGQWICCSDDLPSGISMIPMKWEYFAQEIPLTLFSGFLGVTILNNSLKPVLGWAVGRNIERTLPEWIKFFIKEFGSRREHVINEVKKKGFDNEAIDTEIENLIEKGTLSETRKYGNYKHLELLDEFDDEEEDV